MDVKAEEEEGHSSSISHTSRFEVPLSHILCTNTIAALIILGQILGKFVKTRNRSRFRGFHIAHIILSLPNSYN